MANLKQKGLALLSSTASVDMKTAASTNLYTVPTGFTALVVGCAIRSVSASLAGGTSYSVTNFRQTFDLSSLTATTDQIFLDGNNAKYTSNAAGSTIQFTVTTGSTGAATATIDLWGYIF